MGFFTDAVNASQSFVGGLGTLGINGFVFDIAEECEVSLESEITDHYVEDGTAVQDHIALRPERVVLRGYVGEMVYNTGKEKGFVRKASEKLTTVSSYLPVLSNYASKVYNTIASINFESSSGDVSTIDKLFEAGGDVYQAYRDINIPQDKQSEAFIYFEALRNSRKLLTVQTPYRYYTDMAIETVKIIQSSDSRDGSDVEVTLKKIRFAKVTTSSQLNLASRLANMAAKTVFNGLVKGVKASVSSYWSKATSFFGD